MLGAFEPNAKPWAMAGIPEDFEFDQLPEDFDHFEPILEMAVNRMPMLGEAGIHTFSTGQKALRRMMPIILALPLKWTMSGSLQDSILLASNRQEGLEWLSANGWTQAKNHLILGMSIFPECNPFRATNITSLNAPKKHLGCFMLTISLRQKATARGVRRTPFHQQLKAQGAVFGEIAGWERANWYATDGQSKEYSYSWKRQNWFDNAAKNTVPSGQVSGCTTCLPSENCGWKGAIERFLNRVCGADMSVPVGKIVYTQPQPTWRD